MTVTDYYNDQAMTKMRGKRKRPRKTHSNAIELIHHTQTPERREIVAAAAARYGLFTTGGTDFHGMYSEKPMYPGMLETLLPEGHVLLG
jgi:hypothetical protein